VSLIDLPPGKGRGKWQRVLVDEFGDKPRWSAIIRCPECDMILPIINHAIGNDGRVSPSVGHPKNPCSWHVTPKLIGWAPCPPAPAPYPFHSCENCDFKARQLAGWGTWSGGVGVICPKCILIREESQKDKKDV
jgi:hypothetical protein